MQAGTIKPRFQALGTLRPDSIYIARRADSELPRRLANGELCYVLAPRQIGKSSLRVRAQRHLEGAGIRCASIDLTMIGTVGPDEWYFGLLQEIADQLDLGDLGEFWEQNQHLSPVHRWSLYLRTSLLEQVSAPLVVVFIDEIDVTRSLPFLRDDFFASVRAIYDLRAQYVGYHRLTFCLLGVATPQELIEDERRTPFNVGAAIDLEDFSLEEAQTLKVGLKELAGVDADALLQTIYQWTAGHPYMTQRICVELARGAQSGEEPADHGIDEVVRRCFLDSSPEEDPNLGSVSRLFYKGSSRPQVSSLLQLYRRVLEGDQLAFSQRDPQQMALRLTGIVARGHRDGRYFLRVRNRIYSSIFDQSWVSARLAERRFSALLASWSLSGKQEQLTLRGEELDQAIAWLDSTADSTVEEQEFVRASMAVARREAAARQRRQLQRIALATGAALAIFASIITLTWRDRTRYKVRTQEAEIQRQREELRRKQVELQVLRAAREQEELRAQQRDTELRRKEADLRALRALTRMKQAELESRLRLEATVGREQVAKEAALANQALLLARSGDVADALATAIRATVLATSAGRRPLLQTWEGLSAAVTSGRSAAVRRSTVRLRAVRLFADGSKVVAAGMGGNVLLWDLKSTAAATMYPFRDRIGRDNYTYSLAVSRDNRRFAAGGADGSARIWDLQTGEGLTLPSAEHANPTLQSLAFSPDGKHLATGDYGGRAWVWDLATRQRLCQLSHGARVDSIDFALEGRQIGTSGGGRLKLWSADTCRLLRERRGPDGPTALSTDGQRAATAGSDGVAELWDVETGRQRSRLAGPRETISSIAFSPDAALIATSAGRWVRLWDAQAHQQVEVLGEFADGVTSLSFARQGMLFAAASEDGTVRIWDLTRERATPGFFVSSRVPLSAFFVPGGRSADRWVLISGADGALRLWASADQQLRKELLPAQPELLSVWNVGFSADAQRMITARGAAQVQQWQLSPEEGQAHLVSSLDYGARAYFSSLSADGAWALVAGEGRAVKLWDVGTGQVVQQFVGHKEVVYTAVFSPDARRVLTASYDGTARVWERVSGKVLLTLPVSAPVVMAMFSPAGEWVVTASRDRLARLWDGHTGQLEGTLSGHEGWVSSAMFSPSGREVLTASRDGSVRIWDVKTSAAVAIFRAHRGPVRTAMFSVDGSRILSAGGADDEYRAIIYPATIPGLLQRACARMKEVPEQLQDPTAASACAGAR